MSLNLTYQEKNAVIKVLMDIAWADGKITDGEESYFQQMRNFFGASNSDIEEASKMSVVASLTILKNMSQEQKLALAYMMREMITVDGEIHENEKQIFEAVCINIEVQFPADN